MKLLNDEAQTKIVEFLERLQACEDPNELEVTINYYDVQELIDLVARKNAPRKKVLDNAA